MCRLRAGFSPDIKNIVFDFGGVILDIDLSKTIQAFKKLGIVGISESDTQACSKTFFDEHEHGNISTKEFIRRIRLLSSKFISDDEIKNAWFALLGNYNSQRIELLKKISQRYRIFLLSNTNAIHHEYFCAVFKKEFGYSLESLFEKVFYSDKIHFVKPELEIYQYVVANTQIIPQETLFIDDNFKNIEGANLAGWQTYHLNSKKESILDLFNN